MALAGDTIRDDAGTYTLIGITTPAPGDLCTGSDGVWPCGDRARAALDVLLRGAPLLCLKVPARDAPRPLVACATPTEDIAKTLLAQGHARPAPVPPDVLRLLGGE